MPDHQNNQLTELKWLTDQQNFTRSLLIGKGIINGFDIELVEEDCTFKMCGGIGLTSNGYLVKSGKDHYHFTHYKAYTPPNYPLFYNPDGNPYSVWELQERRQPDDGEGVIPLTPQNPSEELRLFLREKALLIYLEEPMVPGGEVVNSSEVEASSIQMESMPNPKILRFLVMNQKDLVESLALKDQVSKIIGSRQTGEDFFYSDSYSIEDDRASEEDLLKAERPELWFKEIPLRRFGFGCIDPFDCEPEELEASQFPHITDLDDIYNEYVCIINAATGMLDSAMTKVNQWMNDCIYCWPKEEATYYLAQLCEKWEVYKKLNTVSDTTKHKKENVQYFYDWCRDLIIAYHELRTEIIELCNLSKSATTDFERHLLLGLVMRAPQSKFPAALRHHFEQPPIYNENTKRIERVKLFHWRFLMMVKSFYLPYSIPDEEINPLCITEASDDKEGLPEMFEVKITPSYFYDRLLGNQTIPYYYPLSESRFSLNRFWDDFRVRTLTTDQSLSYHTQGLDEGYTHHPHIIKPLRYNIDLFSFYRIEGHIGKQKSEVEPVLQKWQRKFNLSFDVIYRKVDMLTYQGIVIDEETFNTFKTDLQGAEHLAGVSRGGTFIIVFDETEKIIADFSLPYRCCGTNTSSDEDTSNLSEVGVSGRVLVCNSEKGVEGVEVRVKGIDNISPTGTSGEFKFIVDEGSHDIRFVHPEYISVDQVLTVDSTTTDLGVIYLAPKLVTVTVSFRRGSSVFNQGTLTMKLDTGEVREIRITGQPSYVFEKIPRGKHSLTLDLPRGNQYSRPVITILGQVPCASTSIDIDLSDINIGLNSIPNNFNAEKFLQTSYFNALGIRKESDFGDEIMNFFNEVIRKYHHQFESTRVNVAMESEEIETISATIDKIINEPELKTNDLHRIYKKAFVAMDQALAKVKDVDLEVWLQGSESLHMLYLYRIVINQPTGLKTGAKNALKQANQLNRKAFKMDVMVKNWIKEVKGYVAKEFIETLRGWKN